jgi:hypothetical protein
MRAHDAHKRLESSSVRPNAAAQFMSQSYSDGGNGTLAPAAAAAAAVLACRRGVRSQNSRVYGPRDKQKFEFHSPSVSGVQDGLTEPNDSISAISVECSIVQFIRHSSIIGQRSTRDSNKMSF